MKKDKWCPLCGSFESTFEEHKNTEVHRFQFLLLSWNEKRKSLVKNRHGIEITCSIDRFKKNIITYEEKSKKGTYITQIHEHKMDQMNAQSDGITYSFTVKNIKPKESVFLVKCDTLHPYPFFKIDCGDPLKQNDFPLLKPGAKYDVKLKFKPNSIGEYRMSIAFGFQDESCKKQFTVAKEIIIIILNDHNVNIEKPKKSPFTGKIWKNIVEIPPVRFSQDTRYPIPKEIKRVLFTGLEPKGYSALDWTHYYNIKNSFDVGISEENYTTFFHYLLWLDEQGAELKIERYNMENVPIKLVEKNFLELNVPGLAEKRPSLIIGDIIKIKLTGENVAYGGIIQKVLDERVSIKQVHDGFLRTVANAPNRTVMGDVHFEIGRLSYVRMHQAVDLCACIDKMKLIMPTYNNEKLNQTIPAIKSFKNPLINQNEEQKQAIANIVHRSSGDSPFIVYGPPGTGKTITIVEAIYQITKKMPDAKILVCAPSNAACDMLTLKLSDYFGTNKLKRIHSGACIWNIIPEKVKQYSNRETEDTVNTYTGKELSNYQIVVTTLVLVGKYANEFTRTHVIIDEAAQAKEPEAIIAIGGILEPGGQLILAGDPKQLGPLSNSKIAKEYGIEISLLERLMGIETDDEDSRFKNYRKFPQYRPIKQNSNYIIKLKLNYRSHEQIIHIPNHLYYDNELQAVSVSAKNDRISKIIIPANLSKSVQARPIEFFGVSGEEERDGYSPSYFNRNEIQVVMKYVKYLIGNETQVPVKPEEIGIIAPYIRQVMKIRHYLETAKINGVEVGTTETFQGREKRVIIISTVRAKADLLLYDKKYNLGFVDNKKRFNVAVTRAMSKLIIVGNPHVLCYARDNWLPMIKYCQNMRSYRGCYFAERDMKLQKEIVDKLERVKMVDDQYSNH